MSKHIDILAVNHSFESYAFLAGYVMQKKPIDMILQTDYCHNENRALIYQLNHWLKSKGYPLIIPIKHGLSSALENATEKPYISCKELNAFIRGTKTSHIRCFKDKLELNNYPLQWGWDIEVLESVLNLSDLPDTTKKLITMLGISSAADSLSIS